MDETPVYFDIVPGKTVDQVGTKSVCVRTTGSEKRHITVVLAVTASGDVISPMIIFKGKRELKLKCPKGWIVAVQQKAWMDEVLMAKWVKEIYRQYTNRKPSLCVLDSFRAHITEKVKKDFKRVGAQLAVIPGGCTSKLQPLDVSVNKPFKAYLRVSWSNFIREATEEMVKSKETDDPIERLRPADKQLVVNWIVSAVDKLKEKKELIRNSFRVTGIANTHNGSEDHMIRNMAFTEMFEDDSDVDDFEGFTEADL